MDSVTELPPPTGEPVSTARPGDPWLEQARRRERHRSRRRRRRRRIAASVGAGVVGSAVVATAAVLVLARSNGAPASEPAVPSSREAPSSRESSSDAQQADTSDPLAPGTVADGARVVRVDDIWLLDRGNGQFDWGAVLSSTSDVLRADLDVDVVLADADGTEVFVEQVVLPQLAPEGRVVVGGVFGRVTDGVTDSATGAPVRVEVAATSGSAVPGATELIVVVTNVRRVVGGQVDSDDRLLGTVELVEGDVDAVGATVRLAVLWRDDDDRVIASVFEELGRIDADSPLAEFSLRLPRGHVPSGEPDMIVANPAIAS